MSENPGQQAPVHVIQNNQPPTGKSAAGKGVIALVLCAAAFLSAPLLILIPYVGFLPAMLAGAAIIVAWSGLRGATRGDGTAVTGLIIGVVLFAILAGIATVWNLVVADPAILDYDELHDIIEHIKSLVFGS